MFVTMSIRKLIKFSSFQKDYKLASLTMAASVAPSWTGILKYDQHGNPLNPTGNVISSAGSQLWAVGPNLAADAIVVRLPPNLENLDQTGIKINQLEVALIVRKKNKMTAFPGGFLDAKEDPVDAALREFKEECLVGNDAKIVESTLEWMKTTHRCIHKGPIGDSRDSIHRWIETYACCFWLPTDSKLVLNAGDDAESVRWYTIEECLDPEKVQFHANHRGLLHNCVLALKEKWGFEYLVEDLKKLGYMD